MKIVFYLLLVCLISCSASEKLVDPPKKVNDTNNVRIDQINNQIINRYASEDLLNISVGPIKNIHGEIIKNGQQFKISTSDTTLKFKKNLSDVDDLVVDSVDGLFNFDVKVPTKAKQYTIMIQGVGIDSSIGYIYINVNSTDIKSLGLIKSEVFEDLSPYNRIKDAEEMFAIVKDISVNVTIGPIVDKFGNLVNNGQVDALLKNGYFYGSGLADSSNSTARMNIINGYVTFYVSGLENEFGDIASIGVKVTDSTPLDDLDEYDFNSTENSIASLYNELKILNSVLMVHFEPEFGNVFIGKTISKTLTLQNLGNTPIYNRTTMIDAPFSLKGGTCDGKSTLIPLESCTIQIEYSSQLRMFAVGQLFINGNYNNQPLNEQVIKVTAQGALPPNLKINLDDNLISFSSQPVGEVISKAFVVLNTGDVPATNIQFNSPPPYNGTNESYYVFRSPTSSVINNNSSLGEHCGQVFNPQVRCLVYVDFLPKTKVPNDILSGSISFDGGDPVTIFVKGKSYINNYEQNIQISSLKKQINKDEVDTVRVTIGPIRDLYGVPVPDKNITLSVYREKETANGVEIIQVGNISSSSQIFGGESGYALLRTDVSGYAEFDIKSKLKDEVGKFIVKAEVIDEDGNLLTKGSSEYEFVGVKLEFEQDTYNFLTSIINYEKIMSVVLRNTGSVDAVSVSTQIIGTSGAFSIDSEGTCGGVVNGTLDLSVGESCEMFLRFRPTNKLNYLEQIRITSPSIGNKKYSAIYGKGISPAKIETSSRRITGTHVIQGQSFKGKITFNNIGDESATLFNAKTLQENESFHFNFENCIYPFLENNQRCNVEFEYLPLNIPNQELITTIEISARGVESNEETKIIIPIQINHSSIVFVSEQRGINRSACYPMKIKGFDSINNNLDFSSTLKFDLFTDGVGSLFYSDSNCSNTINEIEMPSDQYNTDTFYYQSHNGGVNENLLAKSQLIDGQPAQVAQAQLSLNVYKDPIKFEIVSGDSQKGETTKMLTSPIVFRAIDEDNQGVPFIPVFVDILENMEKKPQIINNGMFNNDISSWVVLYGDVSWYKGAGGSIKMVSDLEVAEIKSFPILVDPNTNYYYSVKITEKTGLSELAYVHVYIEDTNGNVLSSNIIDGVKSKVFAFTTNATTSRATVRMKTAGKSSSTSVYIDSVLFTRELSIANGSMVEFGTIVDSQPIIGNEDNMGNISFSYQGSQISSTPIFRGSTSYNTMSNKKILMNAHVDYPTNIKGDLGDFELKTTGPVLTKNGANNLGQLSIITGYSWDSSTKILTLPQGSTYDFNSVNIESGVTLKFIPKETKVKNEWTQFYTKQACVINGSVKSADVYTDGEESVVKMAGLDGEDISAISPSYVGGTSGNGYSNVSRIITETSSTNANKTEVLYTNSSNSIYYLKGNLTITDTDQQGYVENIDIYSGEKLIKKINGKIFSLPIIIKLENEQLDPQKNLRIVWFGGGNVGKVTPDIDVRSWIPFSSGLNAGSGGYLEIIQTRSCWTYKTGCCRYRTKVACGGWSGQYMNGTYRELLPKQNTEVLGSIYQGGKGAKGRPGIQPNVSTSNPTYYSPAETLGGTTGKRGKDGGNLFIHCYSGLYGSGTVDVQGAAGENGTNGVNGTSSATSGVYSSYVFDAPQRLTYYLRVNGGGGGGSGGNGGHGGNLILKSRIINHNLNLKTNGGLGGNFGLGGTFFSQYGNFQPGQNGIKGINGVNGFCKTFDSLTNIEGSCN